MKSRLTKIIKAYPILMVLWVAVFFVAIITFGYSMFHTSLSLVTTASIRTTANIRITDIEVNQQLNGASATYTEYNKENIAVNVTLPNEDSEIVYKVTITNYGNVVMGIVNLTGLQDNLEYEFLNYDLKDKICDGNSCILGISEDIYLKIKYKEYDSSNINQNIVLYFDFEPIYDVNYVVQNDVTIYDLKYFSSYAPKYGLVLPVEGEVVRPRWDFAGWYKDGPFSGNEILEIEKGEEGEKKFYAGWTPAIYNLIVQTRKADGSIVVGYPEDYELILGKDDSGEDIIISLNESGRVSLYKNQIVSIRATYDPNVKYEKFNFDNTKVLTSVRYDDGNQYVYYDFEMPKGDLVLTFNEELEYIDIYKSSIIFEENVNVGNVVKNGFWYNSSIVGITPILYDSEKGYFYAWDNTEPLYVTSNGKETQNQLILVNAMTIYLKDCVLVARDEYSRDVVGTKIDGYDAYYKSANQSTKLENNLGNKNLESYGNIVLDINTNANYETNIIIDGENTIGSIFHSNYHGSALYMSNLIIDGKNNANLQVGTIFGNFTLNIKESVKIVEYDNDIYEDHLDNSTFILWLYNNTYKDTTLYGDIDCPNKILYYGSGNILIYKNANINVKEVFMGLALNLNNNSKLHVYGNVESGLGNFRLNDSSSLLIEGDLLLSGYEQSSVHINTSGYLIVKGNRAQLHKLHLYKGTVIANNISLASMASLTGGKIISNQITNYVVKGDSYAATDNGDDSTFITYSARYYTYGGTYLFSGTQVYLFGYYQKNGNYFDTSFTAMSEGNPIGPIINKFINDGESSITDEYLNEKIEENKNTNECIILGDTRYTEEYAYGRNVLINAGKIVAAGNITFFNDTVVTDSAVIEANGTFGTKRNLTISGGTITATEVGNLYDIYNTKSDGNNYWQKTYITNGSINANRIGAVSTNINDHVSRSTVYINMEEGNITPLSSSNVTIVNDTYINYVYDNNYTNSTDNLNNVRFTSSGNNITNNLLLTKTMVDDNLSSMQDFNLIAPTYTNASESTSWALDKTSGDFVNKISTNGNILNGNTIIGNAFLKDNDEFREYISLYACKNNYNLNILEGLSYIDSITDENGNSVLIVNDTIELNSNETYIINLKTDDYDMANKTVIWYYDANGVLHSADIVQNDTNGTITFEMPRSDTEVHITDELTLYLNKYSIYFTSDGFAIEDDPESRRSDSEFNYIGDIYITDSNITSTSYNGLSYSKFLIIDQNNSAENNRVNNKLVFESNSGNAVGSILERKITVGNLIQYSKSDFLNFIGSNDVIIGIDGCVQLGKISLIENSSLEIDGINGKENDILYMRSAESSTDSTIIGNASSKTGNVTFKNIHFVSNGGYILKSGGSSSTNNNTFTIDNCLLEISKAFSSGISYGYTNVIINNSFIDRNNNLSNSANGLFVNTKNLIMNNSQLDYRDGDSTEGSGTTFFNGLGNVELNNSVLNIIYTRTSGTQKRNTGVQKGTITLNGNSKLISENKLVLNKLTMNDTSKVIVENSLNASDGSLFCPDIEVNDNSEINADNIIVSGYNNTYTIYSNDAINLLNNGIDIMDGNSYRGIIINDNANVYVRNTIGGNINGKVTINGGSLTAKNIGSPAKLYGIFTFIPENPEDDIVFIEKIATKSTVMVNGGTVNVADNGYLGGMNAEVDIKGGTVNLGNNSIIGINESDTITLVNSITSQGNIPSELVDINITGGTITGLSGYINVPYSTLDINSSDSNLSLNLNDIIAFDGNVNIGTTDNNSLINPLGVGENVGIIINKDLEALNVNICDGAKVYVNNLTIKTNNIESFGRLFIDENSYLYSLHYGSAGPGSFEITINGNVVGNRKYAIRYILNDTYSDPAYNPNNDYYLYGNSFVLENLERYGYVFDGWFDINDNRVTEISNTEVGDKVLIAKWTPEEVEFIVTINADDIGMTVEEFALEVNEDLGILDGNKFTYDEHLYIPYNELFTSEISLSKYNLASYYAIAATLKNEVLNPDDDILNLTSNGSIINRTIMEYYINNEKEPLEISISDFDLIS